MVECAGAGDERGSNTFAGPDRSPVERPEPIRRSSSNKGADRAGRAARRFSDSSLLRDRRRGGFDARAAGVGDGHSVSTRKTAAKTAGNRRKNNLSRRARSAKLRLLLWARRAAGPGCTTFGQSRLGVREQGGCKRDEY